jgi:hypothetical protein
MFRGSLLFTGLFMITSSCFAGANPLDCPTSSILEKNLDELKVVTDNIDDCPAPTRDQFTGVCNSIYDKKDGTEELGIGYKYQEDLWDISCANPKQDSMEIANKKIQRMWLKNRENFRCYKYDGVSVPDGNVLKFSMDSGFSTFLVTAVKKYNLDMNFKDPADGKTIMDFLKSSMERYRQAGSAEKVEEYERIYKLFALNGAKHGKDL